MDISFRRKQITYVSSDISSISSISRRGKAADTTICYRGWQCVCAFVCDIDSITYIFDGNFAKNLQNS